MTDSGVEKLIVLIRHGGDGSERQMVCTEIVFTGAPWKALDGRHRFASEDPRTGVLSVNAEPGIRVATQNLLASFASIW